MNCSKLLEHVQRSESFLPESPDAYFGHPHPPKVSVLVIDGVSLLISQTKRCVSAQIHTDSAVGEPEEVLCLPPQGEAKPDEELITSLAIVTSEDSHRLAVVVGTSFSRILSVEMMIDSSLMMLVRPSAANALHFEPLPLDLPKDSQEDSSHSEALNVSRHDSKAAIVRATKRTTAFRPKGGVHTIDQYNIESKNVVWISYKDGNLVRLPSASFFPSKFHDNDLWKEHSDRLVRAQVVLPPASFGTDIFVVALPKYHPSPLSPLIPWKPDDFDKSVPSSLMSDEEEDSVPEVYEALSYGGATATGFGDLAPTISFYTSEDQFRGRTSGDSDGRNKQPLNEESVLFDNAIEATTAIMGGVFGAAIGVVKWGFGGRKRNDNTQSKGIAMKHSMEEEVEEEPDAPGHFSTMHNEPYKLYSGYELHDAPRLVTSVSIDPEGNLAATTDALGRVLLIDLSTKQVVRIWKGVREASCCWMEDTSQDGKCVLYIVIHSRQRRTVDIWKIRHAEKIQSIQVGRDAQLVPCKTRYSVGCMLLQNSTPGSPINQLELLRPKANANSDADIIPLDKNQTRIGSSTSIQAAAMRLQTLQQLLAETNVPCQKQNVFEALTNIINLKDLCIALDLLSVSSSLAERMSVNGAEFQRLALAHCKQLLDSSSIGIGADTNNPQIQTLSSSIKFHSQLVKAYEVLYEYELNGDGEVEEEKVNNVPLTPWSDEAISWLMTAETVSGGTLDDCVITKKRAVARFATFASSCSPRDQINVKDKESKRYTIYFSDSSRTRKELLVHIFKPLLSDIFSFNVTNSILEHLGLRDDIEYLQTCFGEWFMSIPAKEAANKAFFGLYSPMARWLQEIVNRQISIHVASNSENDFVVLGSLHKFCSSSDDLVRTFTLSSLCREAVSVVAKKKELKTFGKISRDACVHPWETLLRKIRVCLFVSLRLYGMNLGTFPITVENVESNDTFSVYEWVARDELISGHKHAVIVALEKTCKGSGIAFDPSTSVGDNPLRWKLLQLACLATAISEEERAEYLVDFDDNVQGALLLYLGSHNNPSLLVAHRALLLAGKWKNEPSNLELLQDCTEALSFVEEEGPYNNLAAAVRLEVWQTCVRPVFRALFFGFHDVHDVLEDFISPLFLDSDWLQSFGKVSLEVLSLLYRSGQVDNCTESGFQSAPHGDASGTWPPVKEDFILKRLVEKFHKPNINALDFHRAIICGCMVSEDHENLAICVNGFYEAFLPTSIFDPSFGLMGDVEKQIEFLEKASINQACRLTSETIIDNYHLGEIEVLAELWGIEVRDVRTIFFLAMYELGKDTVVDALVTRSAQVMDLNRFVEDGLGIVCRRLNHVLNVKRSAQIRKVMGLLDADTCEWVREHAELSVSLIDEISDDTGEMPLSSTHLFILRLLSFSKAMGAKAVSVQIHSLSVLSGTLMKASN